MVSEEIRGMIPDYVRGLLSPDEAVKVASALSSNPELIKEYEAAQKYYRMLDQLPETKAPPELLERINKRIDRQTLIHRITDLLFRPFFLKIPIEFAGLAVSVVLLIIIFKPQIAPHQAVDLPLAVNRESFKEIEVIGQTDALEKKAAPRAAKPLKEKRDNRIVSSFEPQKIAPPEPLQPAIAAEKKSEEIALSAQADSAQPASDDRMALARTDELKQESETPKITENESEEKSIPSAIVDVGIIELAYAPSPSSMSKAQSEIMADQAYSSRSQASIERKKSKSLAEDFEKSAAPAAATPLSGSSEPFNQKPAMPSISVSEILDSMLFRYDSMLTVKTQDGKVMYTLAIAPEQLTALSKDLGRSFSIKSKLLPFDPLITKKITLTIIAEP
jgi:hypothetical protein